MTTNPALRRASQVRYRQSAKGREATRARDKRYRLAHPERERAHARRQVLSAYGLTPADFQAMYDSQGGLCAVCRVSWATHVDHDHKTGRVRGLLCNGCNRGIGTLYDQPTTLVAAAAYLGG